MKNKAIRFLRWTERFTETDMLYAVKGTFWIIFGKAILALISFAKMMAFGRWAGQEVYGTYSFIISMLAILSIFSLPGMETSLVKAFAKKRDGTLKLATKERLKFSLIGSLASLCIFFWYFSKGNSELSLAFLIISLLLPFKESLDLFSPFWTGKKDFKKRSIYTIVPTLVSTLAVAVTIYLGQSPALIVLSFMLSLSLVNLLFLALTLNQKENDETDPESIRFGKDLTVVSAISMLANNVDKIILWKFFGPIQLAIYSFAQTPIQQIQGAIPIKDLALPKVGSQDVSQIKDGLIKKFKKLFFVSVPAGIGAIALAPLFYKILLPQYVDSIAYFQVFSIVIILSPFILLESALLAEMKKREIYIMQISVPLIRILLFLLLIPFLAIWGVVLAIIISQIINGVLSYYFFKTL